MLLPSSSLFDLILLRSQNIGAPFESYFINEHLQSQVLTPQKIF